MNRRLALWLLLALGSARACAGAEAAPATDRVVSVMVPELQLHGVGLLRFGDHFQWQLRTGPPVPIASRDGGWIGGVFLESVDQSAKGAFRQKLPEPPASAMREVGPSCTVLRADVYAIIRCMRDYLFNTKTGKPAIELWPQFSDRINPSPEWLATMPLPWWRPTGSAIVHGAAGDSPAFLFLEYGWINYGNAIESSEIDQGPALLDLATGRIVRARAGTAADGPIYDRSAAAEDQPVAMSPSKVIRDDHVDGRRVITVLTLFDRCVAATCRSDNDPKFARLEPLTYAFD